jgi:uncharacterized protein YjbI with pentapeptide repeats
MGTQGQLTRRRNLALSLTALFLAAGCEGITVDPQDEQGEVEARTSELQGTNLAGTNLAGVNLSGVNLSGANLSGANLGGTNLAGTNLSGVNLSGTNLAGNNLAGNNLSGTNLAGVNLAGVNLSGVNLSGVNLSGSNLSGSNLSGTNLSGNNLSGTNLSGTNLSGTNSGANIHNLSGSTGMLYSREDVWTPRTAGCAVMGIGSTAFAKLLGQNVTSPKINVALGKLPWGFANSPGGAKTLNAWEAIVWGNNTYCVFVLAADPSVTYPGVQGFIKAVFRWNAPTTQSMDISGIEAAGQAPVSDTTTATTITTYTGMMDAAAKLRAGTINELGYMAGLLAFSSATTNNTSVKVDFASWVRDSSQNALVLGNVDATDKPKYAEAVYIALDNGDGSVQVIIDDAASRANTMPPGVANSVVDLDVAYLGAQENTGWTKPKPRRCGGSLFLQKNFSETPEAGKCDTGLDWTSGFCATGSDPWSMVAGTTAPFNEYMQLTKAGGKYKRAPMAADGSCGTYKPVLSETYVHMWEPSFDITPSGSCTSESTASFCARRGKNCGSVTGTDNCGVTRTYTCGTCATGSVCGGAGGAPENVCGAVNARIYEAEASGHDLQGKSGTNICYQAFTKTFAGRPPAQVDGACWGGGRIRWLGNGDGNTNEITMKKINVSAGGQYTLTVWAMALDPRYYDVSVNSGTAQRINIQTPTWSTSQPFTMTITLNAGDNTIRFFNSTTWAPDLDRIEVLPLAGPPSLTVYDSANAASWAVKSSFQIGSGGAHPWPDYSSTYVGAWHSSLNNLLGKTWIQTKSASKLYTGGPEAAIGLTATSNVYLFIDDRWGTPPSWMSGWTDTGYNVTIKENGSTDRAFSVFKKTGVSGSVSLPKIGANTAFNYFAIVE